LFLSSQRAPSPALYATIELGLLADLTPEEIDERPFGRSQRRTVGAF
jgi:hypothetical protein